MRAVGRQAGKVLVEGLKLFVPQGGGGVVREQMANLNRVGPSGAYFELDERDDALVEMELHTHRGNAATRLVHATNEAALERFAASIAGIKKILPNCEVAVVSAAELAFRGRGLEEPRDNFRVLDPRMRLILHSQHYAVRQDQSVRGVRRQLADSA